MNIKFIINFLFASFVEIFAFAAVLIFSSFNLARLNPTKNLQPSKKPILLVHGYMHNSSAWVYIRYKLKKENIGPIFTINLSPPLHSSIQDYAEQVRKMADKIELLTGRKDLCLIGHSMGGLVITYYAENVAPRDKLLDIITYLSPMDGTYMGNLGWGPCAKEMSYKSEFIKTLEDRVQNFNKNHCYCHIATKTDLLIMPWHSQLMKKNPRAFRLTFECCGHVSSLFYNKGVELMVKFFNRNEEISN